MTRLSKNSSKTTRCRGRRFEPRSDSLEGRQLLSAGDLDPTFGQAGVVFTPMPAGATGTGTAFAPSVESLSDGKLLVGGKSSTGDFALARYNDQGTLDATFGSQGRVTTDFKHKIDIAADMATLPDGRIVLAGYADMGTGSSFNYDFALARFLPNGSLDRTFGSSRNGKVTTNISTVAGSSTANHLDTATSLAVQPDGKIILAGESYDGTTMHNDPALVRYNADGTLDTSFGPSHSGKVVTPVSTANDDIGTVAIQPHDGKIVIAGCAYPAGENRLGILVARYNADGTLDTSFGPDHNGIVITTVGATGAAIGSDLVLKPDGSMVVSGRHFNGVNWDVTLMRFTPTGALDAAFGTGGVATIGPVHGLGYGLTLQPDGKFVVAGAAQPDGSNTVDGSFLARVLPDGSLDPRFAGGGMEVVIPSPSSNAYAYFRTVSLQADGKIVAVGGGYAPGTSPSTSPEAFMVARFEGDPVVSSGTLVNTASGTDTSTPGADTFIAIAPSSARTAPRPPRGGSVPDRISPGGPNGWKSPPQVIRVRSSVPQTSDRHQAPREGLSSRFRS